ncbi:hypothetical protein JST97_18925 [bacterium]|nr:hypothetical protein [bacterium]
MLEIEMENWYQLDEQDRIIEVSPHFDRFSSENGGPADLSRQVIGRSLWDFVKGDTLKMLLQLTLQRAQQGVVCLKMRCDAPHQLRLLEMLVTPDRRVGFTPLKVEQRLPGPDPKGAIEPITMCAWCNTFETEQGWLPLEQASAFLPLLYDSQREISHGMCPPCEESFDTGTPAHLEEGFRH